MHLHHAPADCVSCEGKYVYTPVASSSSPLCLAGLANITIYTMVNMFVLRSLWVIFVDATAQRSADGIDSHGRPDCECQFLQTAIVSTLWIVDSSMRICRCHPHKRVRLPIVRELRPKLCLFCFAGEVRRLAATIRLQCKQCCCAEHDEAVHVSGSGSRTPIASHPRITVSRALIDLHSPL